MARYIIWAAEEIYGGLHGMNYQGVIEADSNNEALEYAREEAIELIYSYECIEEALEEDVQEEISSDMTKDEITQLRTEIYNEDLEYNYWKIDEKLAENYTTKELDDMCYNLGLEEMIAKFTK